MVGISLRGVSKRFGRTVAVEDVSLQIEKGELFFLLGPSGCGKTTILRMIAGFCQADSGQIFFDDRYIDPVPPHRRNLGMVFQNYALWPHMSVAQNVAYGLKERSVSRIQRRRLTEKALEAVHMGEYAARMPNQLSGGQQQRVALARALVIEPDAVLLDEPLSNLDAKLRVEMRTEIRRIHHEVGITMLYVTHDQKEALSMAQRLAVMSMGRVEQVGDPRSVYRCPENRFVASFVGEANLIPGTFLGSDGAIGRLRTRLGELQATVGAVVPKQEAQAWCMVRPENLKLSGTGQNCFEAVLQSSVYLGEVEQFVLDHDGIELKAMRAAPGQTPPPIGERVQVHFDVEDAVMLG